MKKLLLEKSGEAVMLVIMGVMLVGGIVLWLSGGNSHMMGKHGGKHTKEKAVSSTAERAHEGHAVPQSEGSMMESGEHYSEGK